MHLYEKLDGCKFGCQKNYLNFATKMLADSLNILNFWRYVEMSWI